MTWTEEDIRVASVIGGAFPGAYVVEVIKHSKENGMTETTVGPDTEAEGIDWSDAEGAVSYPEIPDNPHNHRFTISVDGRGPMIVVRGNTAQETREAFEELTNGGVLAAAQATFQALKGAPAPQAMPPAMMSQPNYNPQMPPPNQPYAGQPAWQQAGAPQQAAPQWGAPQAPQGGGQQQGQRKEYPAPQGWMRMQGRKEQVDAIAQAAGVPKGNPNKGGMYNFFGLPTKAWYCDPRAAAAFAQLTPMAA